MISIGWVLAFEPDGPGAPTGEGLEELRRLRKGKPRAEDGARKFGGSGGLLREGKLVKREFTHAERAYFPITVLCRVLGVSTSLDHAVLGQAVRHGGVSARRGAVVQDAPAARG